MVTVADADLVVSEMEVAVTVTVAGLGGAAGAEYVVAAPLAVVVGLKLPHDELPQVTDQVTPAFALSLLTVAVKAAVVLAATELGGLFRATEIGTAGVVMERVAVADLVGSVTEVAVIVTVAGLGAVVGAVYFVAVPLGVEAVEKLPHDELPQVTFQVTPALALSLLTSAVRLVDVPASREAGG
jgi:hypothetical protein